MRRYDCVELGLHFSDGEPAGAREVEEEVDVGFEEAQPVGRLHEIGLVPAAHFVSQDQRLDVAHERSVRPLASQPFRDNPRAALGVEALVDRIAEDAHGGGVRSRKGPLHVVGQGGQADGFRHAGGQPVEPFERPEEMIAVVRVVLDHPVPRLFHQA